MQKPDHSKATTDGDLAERELNGPTSSDPSLLVGVYLPYFQSSQEAQRAAARKYYEMNFGREAIATKWIKVEVQPFLEKAGNAKDALVSYLDVYQTPGIEKYISEVFAALRGPLPTNETELRAALRLMDLGHAPHNFYRPQQRHDLSLLLVMAYIEEQYMKVDHQQAAKHDALQSVIE